MSDELPAFDCPSRRGLLRGLAAVGVTAIAAGVLTACSTENSRMAGSAGEDGGTGGTGSEGTGGADSTGSAEGAGGTGDAEGTEDPQGAADGTSGSAAGDGAGEASIPLAEVPVGEAVVVAALGSRYVVAQPTAGEVVAFSAACTHAGTEVVPDGGLELRCPNHGSRFDAGDAGAVLNGPASAPLPEVRARVEGDLVVLSA